MLNLSEIDAALSGTIFCGKLQHFETIGSTNLHAMQQGSAGAPSGSVFIADEQTAGRGRGAHTWHSAANNGLYLSVLIRPRISAADALWLSLATALAVRSAVQSVTTLQADIRWPNDLVLQSNPALPPRKFCGILAELSADPTEVRHAVLGIGINLNHASFPPELAALATSLHIETGREWSRTDLLIALLKSLDLEIDALSNPATVPYAGASIRTRFLSASTWATGKSVTVTERPETLDDAFNVNPGEIWSGITAGLDERGFLLVRTEGGSTRTVISGSVRETLRESSR